MLQVLILALVFLGTVGLLVGGYVFVNRRSLAATDSALERLREIEHAPGSARSILRDVNVSELPLFDRLLAGRELTDTLSQQIQRAGVSMTPGSFLLRVAIFGVGGLILARFFVSAVFFAPILGAIAGGMAPVFWLRRKQARRLRAFQEQLPDAIDMMVSAMKAGYSFQAAMKFIGEEITAPLGPEFARFYEEQRLGMEVRTALISLQERIDSLDLRMLVTAILIQRETGGNLGEVLDKISGLMRERQAIKGEIATLTAESKLSARILGSLPFVVFAAVNVLNPGFMRPLLDTDSGPWVLFGATCSVMMGYWMMMKIADIDI